MRRSIHWIIIYVVILSCTAQAQEPVDFADANLKAAVEQALGITDPTEADMLGLMSLSAEDRGISNLAGLEYARNLQELTLNENNISDINALSALSNLISLNLFGNQINDINALSMLTNLEFIYLGRNQITNVEALSTLTRLRFLALGRNNIADIAPLSALINLDNLHLESNQITDISALENLTNLINLTLGSNQIADISVLSILTQLDSLELDENQITDISILADLTNLQNLDLHSNQIRNISPLSDLPNLQILSLYDNQISDISPLSGLVVLKNLYLNENQISDISPLSNLIGLERLSLDDNQISDISPLFGLTNLYYLGLRSNPLNIEAYTTYIPRLHRFDTTVFYDPLVWRTLTIRSTAGGSVVEPGEGEFDYMDKAVVTVSAVPDEGYYFVNWAGSGVRGVADPVAAGTTVTMGEDFRLRANFERIRLTLYVDDNAPNDPAPNNPQVSDPNEDGTPEHPYDTIQEAIDIAGYRDTVLVYPGIYQEEIIFMGKAITVQGVAASDGIPILENPDDFAVSFYHGEESDSILRNFVIRNSFMAVFIAGSSPTITNLTVIDNKYGIEAYADSYPDISNSIFWNNTDGDLFQCRAWYSCIEVIDRDSDRGNIDADPLFVDPANGDYHLRSTRGRYWPEHDIWVLDNMTSSCIDAGDPTVDPSEEPMPNGGRINMGAYGRTAYASMNEPSVTGEELPPEVIEQVRCITGGFHDEESTWFVATYHNGSDYTITQITVNLGLTDEETGEQEWYRVVLGPLGAVIPPGETVVLAGDIGIAIGDRDFCWEVVEMLGYID